MSNYYERDEDGVWCVSDGQGKVRLGFSGSMEIAYRQGIQDACKQILDTPYMKSTYQLLAEFHALECDESLCVLHEVNSKLKERLDNQCKPSEALR